MNMFFSKYSVFLLIEKEILFQVGRGALHKSVCTAYGIPR